MLARTMLRSASRQATALRSSAGRRWASTSAGNHAKSSDMPWMVGSAAVFGAAAVYLSMSSSDQHAAHAVQHGTSHMDQYHKTDGAAKSPEDAVGSSTARVNADDNEKHGKSSGAAGEKPEDVEKSKPAASGGESQSEESPSGDADAEKASIKRGLATDAPAQAQHAEIDGKDQAKQPAVPVSGDSQKESSGGEEDEGRKAEDIPDEEIKASMRQAEEAAVPRAAMAKEKAEAHK